MSETYVSKLDPRHPEYEAYAAKVKEFMKAKDFSAIGEIIGGLIQEEIVLEDIVPEIIGEFDWSDVTGMEQLFRAPLKWHGNTAVTMENGMTLPTAKVTQNKVNVPIEYVTTPAYPVDTNDIKVGDLVTIEAIKNAGKNALITAKCQRLYTLLCSEADMTDPAHASTKVTVLVDQGTYSDASDDPAYIRELTRNLGEAVSELQETSNGRPVIKGFCRQVTLDKANKAELSGVDLLAIPAAQDDLERPIFTEGDIVLVAPYAANAATIMDVESDEEKSAQYTVSYAQRWGHKWILWGTQYLRRFIIIDQVAGGAPVVDEFTATSLSLYFSKPVLKSTITALTGSILVEATGDTGTQLATFTTATDVTIAADMRHVTIALGGLTAGSAYNIIAGASLTDVGGEAFCAATTIGTALVA